MPHVDDLKLSSEQHGKEKSAPARDIQSLLFKLWEGLCSADPSLPLSFPTVARSTPPGSESRWLGKTTD
jgi:hypothetical protein